MANERQKQHKEILQKQEILDTAKQQLKKDFIGIDQVIDDALDSLSSWYLFPDLQERPIVVNLWGLTGVGKSSLVNRIAELIHFDDKYFRFDLGENETRGWAVKRQLEEIYENLNGIPTLIALDEFHHARTLDDIGNEIDKTSSRIIWQLLDSGKFQITRDNYYVEEIYDLILRLRYLLKKGVRVIKGKVISKIEYFIDQMELRNEYEKDRESQSEPNLSKVLFVPTSFYDGIYSIAKEKFTSAFEVQYLLAQLSGYETIQFLMDVFSYSTSPKTVDCSKALIFVIGNLDEAYKMSHDFNPDMDADEFHEQSLKITIPIIKMALKQRFRTEQIARLGNIHIIYPAFNRESFKKIIDLELSKIANKVRLHHKIELKFDQSVHDLIYSEGVYPTQGTRPIFTTIHQIVNSKLGKVITAMILKNIPVSQVKFKALESKIIIEYFDGKDDVYSLTIDHQLNLEKLRRNKKDDVQAITAVHESGHAIISIILLRTLPEVIFSNTAEVGTAGFIYTKFKWKYISRKEIKNRLALFLAGYVAEKIIFSEENLTTGAEEDIEKATEFATEMIKKCGMGSIPASYHTKGVNTRFYVHDETNSISKKVEKWLKSAMQLAEKTLKEQELLLLKMADYLSDNRSMTKDQTKEMLVKFATNFNTNELIEDGDCLFYRNHLKKLVLSVRKDRNTNVNNGTYEFALNKKYQDHD